MKKTTALFVGSAFALWIAAADAAAQAPAAAPATAPVGSGNMALRAKSILGSKVQIQGNTSVGTVDDIVLNNDGVVDYVLVMNQGKLISVPWEAVKFNFEQRTATINITQQQYQAIPTFSAEQYPNFYAPDYWTTTYRYYGLTPGQQRRLERRANR